jgi:hypothetical protein
MADPAAFSEQSLRRMQGVNPALVGLMKEVERRALDQGIKVEVSEGLRDPGRQAELVEQGKSQTLNSKHLKGNALDIHVRNPDGSANWDFDAYRPVAEIAKQVAAEKGVPNLVWGGDWKSLRDGVHFELAGSNYAAPQGTRKSNMMRGGAGQTSLLGQSGGDTLEPERPRGLLGGFFGPEGRDARSRLAIALEGMTLNPNTALIGSLQEGIKGRRDDKRTNATVQWLRSRGRDDLAAAIDGGLPAADALRIAMQPAEAVEGVSVGGNLVNPITGEIIYQGAEEQEQGEVRQIGDRLVRVNPDGTVAELYAAPQATVTQATGLELGLTGEDAGKLFNVDPSGKITAIGGGATTVNVDATAKGASKFEEAFAAGDANTINTVYASGLQAARNIGRINQLDQLLRAAPTGAVGAIKSIAGEFGIKTDGLSEIQAAQALINSLVPEQRQPGSGSMSDSDLDLFKQSLPRIINQPGGNQLIIETMRAIAQYDAEGASIVQKLRAGEIDRTRAFEELQFRPNPLANFRVPAGSSASAAAPAQTATPPMPADFAAKYGAEAARNKVSIEELWEAWPDK